jgi:hypothetical protein
MTHGSASTNAAASEMLSGLVASVPWLMNYDQSLCGIAFTSAAEMPAALDKQI